MIGKLVSHYKILEKLGQGGMGSVYKAQDTKLERLVAIKFLPSYISADSEERARFELEAKAAAALNHPNIATIYGIEESEGETFIVMEYIHGQSLREKVSKGPLKINEAMKYATQIAEGLKAAHNKDIVHRDIKSDNIMIDDQNQVKIMDFGLAKLATQNLMTKQGSRLGTAAYMSPEQARGETVDHRTDIWSLGIVIYEMVSGNLPFKGEYEHAVIYSILNEEPEPLTSIRTGVPIALDQIVSKMLRKDVSTRYQHVDELPVDFNNTNLKSTDVIEYNLKSLNAKQFNSILIWRAIALISFLVLLTIVIVNIFNSDKVSKVGRWNISLPDFAPLSPKGSTPYGIGNPAFVVSPNGNNLVYVADIGSNTQLYLRRLDTFETTPIPRTEGAYNPFFSPDGEWIGFFANDQLKKISINGGSPITLCEVVNAFGASWGSNDKIVFVQNQGDKLSWISTSDGTIKDIEVYTRISWPEILPGGKAIIANGLKIIFLETGKVKEIPIKGSNPKYLSTGHLLFTQNERVMAASFDLKKMEMIGSPVSVIENIRIEANRYATQYSISNDGTLFYQTGTDRNKTRLLWLDRKGNIEYLKFPAETYGGFQLSPDGHKLAVGIEKANWNIWIYDLLNNVPSKFTSDGNNANPIWRAADKTLIYQHFSDSTYQSLMKSIDGIEPSDILIDDPNEMWGVYSCSPDGKLLSLNSSIVNDIMLFQFNNEKKIIPYVVTNFHEWGAAFSPNGQWISYVSNEKGNDDVYVQPYPSTGERWQISVEGGEEPVWSRTTNELFYRNKTKWMAVKYQEEPNFKPEQPEVLFEGDYVNIPGRSYDVSPDGKRFLLLKSAHDTSSPTKLNVVVNWFDELKEKMKSEDK